MATYMCMYNSHDIEIWIFPFLSADPNSAPNWLHYERFVVLNRTRCIPYFGFLENMDCAKDPNNVNGICFVRTTFHLLFKLNSNCLHLFWYFSSKGASFILVVHLTTISSIRTWHFHVKFKVRLLYNLINIDFAINLIWMRSQILIPSLTKIPFPYCLKYISTPFRATNITTIVINLSTKVLHIGFDRL